MWEAIDAASTKPFGYMRFTPGPGVGGHCLPVDPSYLSWQVKRRLGQSFRFVELANDVNEHMPDYVVRRLFSALNEQGKADQGQPHPAARHLLQGQRGRLARERPATGSPTCWPTSAPTCVAADPHVAPDRFPDGAAPVPCTAEELAAADAVVLLVDHDAFDPDDIVAHARYVLDTKGRLPRAANVERL